jgi:copper chaperone CopZ
MIQTYPITGMHCGSCVAKVTAALRPFADDVAVTLAPPQAILTNMKGKLADLQAAVSKVGAYGIHAAAETAAPVSSGGLDSNTGEGDGASASWLSTYQPLLLIVGYIAVASLVGSGSSSWLAWMINFMAGFFLVFSAFKFLNLSGFADAYATYDLLAKRWRGYGYIYPFLELALGLAYLFRVAPTRPSLKSP